MRPYCLEGQGYSFRGTETEQPGWYTGKAGQSNHSRLVMHAQWGGSSLWGHDSSEKQGEDLTGCDKQLSS